MLKAPRQKLSSALRAGGMVPDLRALCLKEIAMRVQDDFGGDLRMGLAGTLPEVRKILKSFHGIADPGADRILLFAGIKPIAAVPSNCPQVLPESFTVGRMRAMLPAIVRRSDYFRLK